MKQTFILVGLLCMLTVSFGQNVGIGTTTPVARLQVTDSSVLFSAAGDISTADNPPASGTGRRMMWWPGKAAFRAGFVNGNQWDRDSIGNYSLATGYATKATGVLGTAMGFATTARGYASVAFGRGTIANGDHSFAVGNNNTVNSNNSFAAGQESFTNGNVSAAIGFRDSATGNGSLALGAGLYSRSFGEVATGHYNLDYTPVSSSFINPVDRVFSIGNGTNPGSRSNALTVFKNGRVGIGTITPSQKLDVNGAVNAAAVTTPQTGTANMLSVAYGIIFGSATNTLASSSGNCTVSHTPGTGLYTITFTSSNLSGDNLGSLPVVVSSNAATPGFISWTGTIGSITVLTYNSVGVAADSGFSFAVYKP